MCPALLCTCGVACVCLHLRLSLDCNKFEHDEKVCYWYQEDALTNCFTTPWLLINQLIPPMTSLHACLPRGMSAYGTVNYTACHAQIYTSSPGPCCTTDVRVHQPMKFHAMRNNRHPHRSTSAYALSNSRDLNSVLCGSTCILKLTASEGKSHTTMVQSMEWASWLLRRNAERPLHTLQVP